MMTNLFSIFDPATPNILSSNWNSIFIFLMVFPLATWTSPSRINHVFYLLINYVFSEFKPLTKKAPFILLMSTILFTAVMFNNIPGLMPYVFTASSHIGITLSLAMPIWVGLMIYGWLNNTSNLLTHLIPQGTPKALMPFMVLIETISALIRPMTLAVRLAANMIAGHLLMVLLASAFTQLPLMASPVLFSAQIMLSSLEIAVAFIQAYVFSILITLYSAETIN
uniref:ATP synthase subunit a n=1 Tax=Onisimus nanseni TaxID=583350 RepID=D3G9K6_ONINA|nr:ATP synthase F0 subunit 6 [Onisimus nanseni]